MLSTSDRLDIQDVYARYAHAFDHGLAREWSEVFTPDGTFDIDGTQHLAGRKELEEFARGMYSPPGMRHFVSNLLVAGSDTGATGRAYVQVMLVARDESLRLLNLGEYEDILVRVQSSWLFSSRRFVGMLPADLAGAPVAVARRR